MASSNQNFDKDSGAIGNIIANMQRVSENLDGTLNSGYMSITSVKYRDNPNPQGYITNGVVSACNGSNVACTNLTTCSTTNSSESGHFCSNQNCGCVVEHIDTQIY